MPRDPGKTGGSAPPVARIPGAVSVRPALESRGVAGKNKMQSSSLGKPACRHNNVMGLSMAAT